MRPFASQSALQPQYRFALYRTWGRIGLSAIRPAGAVMTMILIGLGAGGCSLSRSDGGAFAKMDDNQVTGAITPPAAPPVPTESDLAFARTAASDVLTKGDKDSSQPWENPETGARGSVTPLSQAMPRMTHLLGFSRNASTAAESYCMARRKGGRGHGKSRPQAVDAIGKKVFDLGFRGSCINATGSPDEVKGANCPSSTEIPVKEI